MEQTVQDFFHDFRQELLAGTEANSNFQLAEFMEAVTGELMETGFIDGFEFCHFQFFFRKMVQHERLFAIFEIKIKNFAYTCQLYSFDQS